VSTVAAVPSLTRIEATERAELLSVQSYHIALDLTGGGDEFRSRTTIRFACQTRGASTFLDVKAAQIESVRLNGDPIDVAAVADGRVELKSLAIDNTVEVVAQMAYSSDGEGLHRHVDPADGLTYLYAMSFLDAAPRWFAAFDQPDLKANFELDVQCPPDWTVLGNGPPVRQGPGRWRITSTQPLSTYFVTLVAGPYHSIYDSHDGIRLGLHARSSLTPHLDSEAADMLQVTKAAFDRYHELFGVRYPFGEYHQAFVPDFNAGAMENPGCVTLRDLYVFRSAATHAERGVRAGTIVHEMAHMWFGDLVTMRWWDDLWLNESFAEYLAQRVCAEVTDYPAWTDFGIHRKDWGYVADQAPSTHPVAGNGSDDAASALADFDGISYAKGAAVLKQLAAYLGDDVFFGGLRAHFAAHAYGNADFGDLIAAWTAAGAHELDEWAGQWLSTAGLDTLSAETADGTVTVTRHAPDASNRLHTVRVAGFDRNGTRLFDEPRTLGAVPVNLAERGAADLVVVDSTDDTWAKVRFGDTSWATVGQQLCTIEAAATRVVIYNAIRDAVRDAELDPAVALQLLLNSSHTEPHDLIVAEVLRFATDFLAGPYAPVDRRAELRGQIYDTARELLAAAEPGSDAQLEATRAVIHATDDQTPLRAWLAGQQLPSGLTLDAELRWAAVTRLAALGGLDDAGIAAELRNDSSTSGVVHAARSRAVRPDAESKAAAWQLLTEPSSVPAYELYATADGFFEPNQVELTSGYVERFFTEMPATVVHRSGWALAKIVLLGYPTTVTTPETLRAADYCLQRTDLDSGVRRSLIDGTDVLRRSLTSLARYNGG
jgi:aminopeptidase N